MLNEGQVMLNEGQAATALPESITTTSTSLIDSLKNAMQPEAIANKLGIDKNMLIDISLFGAIGFIVGFLLKKYSEYFISMALLVIGIVVLQQFDYLAFSLNMPKIHQMLGLESTAAVGGYGMLLVEWIKSNVAGFISLTIGFLIGLKVG